MNKTAIKNFAIWARNKLIADIHYRAGLLGITAEGIANPLPQSTGDTEFYDIGTAEPYSIHGQAVKQRKRLVELLNKKADESDYAMAYKYVLEEVAYTWFNRLIAVRFMEVNDYLPSHIRVLSSESGKVEPDLVTMPFDADLEFTEAERTSVIQMKQDNLLDELFRLLFIKECNALNEILPALFEKTNDYTELLLSISVIDKEDVFVAKIASSLQISCNSLNVCFLISMFSIAASTIKSQSVQISFTPVVIFAKIASAAACSIFPLATRFSKPFAILAFPFAANSSLISHKHTSYPSVCANACAIPEPMVPAPIIPTFMSVPPYGILLTFDAGVIRHRLLIPVVD